MPRSLRVAAAALALMLASGNAEAASLMVRPLGSDVTNMDSVIVATLGETVTLEPERPGLHRAPPFRLSARQPKQSPPAVVFSWADSIVPQEGHALASQCGQQSG